MAILNPPQTRPLTALEIHAREKVYRAAFLTNTGVTLSRDETAALWQSILNTGVELAFLRDQVKA